MGIQGIKPAAASLIKPYLKKLTLRVHPDFFHGDSIKCQHNAQSLQQLYTILDPILHPATTTVAKAASVEPIHLKFYNKLDNGSTKSKAQRRKQPARPTMTQDVVFSDPKQTWPTVNSFFSLCQQLDINVLPSDQDAVRSMITQQQQQDQQRKTKGIRKPHRSFGEEFAHAFYKEQQQQQPQQEWTRSRILEQKLFMCDPQVDARRVADKFAQWLPHLRPEQWWGKLPTLYLAAQAPPLAGDSTKGVLILDDSMTLEDIDKYIQQHLKTKMKEYQDQQSSTSVL